MILCYVIREVCIIFQTLVVLKPKYIRAMLRWIHIINTKSADFILQKAYLANIFINPRKMSQTFYEIDLLFEH